ncbi:MAG TPA: ABC transporter permease [Anaerolineae bacterium]|nr:ABC transporter permease [Anaerolineae bacterium]HPL29227.1 ABC transporter permease [Anaerolineae bacterium]
MVRYIIRRVLISIPVLLGVSLIAFFLVQASGDPMAVYNANPNISAEDLVRLQKTYGFDKPVYVQYLYWLRNALTGNWGQSFLTHQDVLTMIGQRMGNTLLLMGTSFVLTILISMVLGIYSATHKYSLGDYVVTTLSFFGYAMPSFWFGLMLIIVFAVRFKELGLPSLPAAGMYPVRGEPSFWELLKHMVLPVTVLSLISVAKYTRYLRSSMLEVIGQDYIRTARGKGASERQVLWRHAFKNAVIPLVTLIMMDIPSLFSGALITEQVFAWPGMGRMYWEHAVWVDYPVLMGIILLVSTLVVVCNLLADVSYAIFDPRIRLS